MVRYNQKEQREETKMTKTAMATEMMNARFELFIFHCAHYGKSVEKGRKTYEEITPLCINYAKNHMNQKLLEKIYKVFTGELENFY